MLAMTGLAAGYGRLEVMRGVELHVDEGECVALIGWSGAGKTTLLETLAGLLHAVRGDIIYRGRSILECSPRERVLQGLVLVPEGRRLFTGLTVEENLLVGAYINRDRRAVRKRMSDVYELFP